MSNCWKASAQKVGTKWMAVVRRVDKAEPYCLKGAGQIPLTFPTELEARVAAAEHLIDLWNTELRFEIARPSIGHRSLEETTFGTVSSKKGKATVDRRRRRKQANEKRKAAIA